MAKKTAESEVAVAEPSQATPPKEDPAVIRQRMLDAVRDEAQEEIRQFTPTVRQSVEDYLAAKEHAASLKKIMEGNQKQLGMLCDRMTDAMDGTYQFPPPPAPTLPFPENKEDARGKPRLSRPDHGATLPIDALMEFGLTEKMCETLESHDIKTISDLETLMRVDPWWHKKIKGFGGERVDKTSDALVDFRRKYPVPSASDVEPAADESPSTNNGTSTSETATAKSNPDPAEDAADDDEGEGDDGEE